MAPKVLSENAIARLKHGDLLAACKEWGVEVEPDWRQLEIRAKLARVIYNATHPSQSKKPAGAGMGATSF